ncbi:MAG TPA: 5'-3' exonuclease H3TH domain-containing protein [Opitutaceae bacterium]|jgi:DNA polymerase-1|nr:5'-3' exonuclease H3TH domain-containing protein [Opitutaceae bacterium]
MAKWLLIDGFNLAYRCFFAIPELTRADGFPTNALHGWVKSLWKLGDQEKPDGVLVFFDLGGAQDRLALHPEYKAHRKEMPEALVKQLPYLKQLTRAMGFAGIEQDGVESDDLLAAEAVALARAGHDVLIVSSDKDFAQIVGEKIKIMLPPPSANPKLGWRLLDAAGVVEKFGVPPAQIADYLALVGDTSDNIPGLSGVGPKTAVKWLQEFGSLEGVLAHAGELKPERFREPAVAAAENLRRNLKLTTLNLALPPPAAQRGAPQPTEIFRLLGELEMKGCLADARSRYSGQTELF